MDTHPTKERQVPCIWRTGCDGKHNCQSAGLCLGTRSDRGEPDYDQDYKDWRKIFEKGAILP
jgi:hypothetical protein